MTELKPCPFCGSTPHKPRKTHDGWYVNFEIACSCCTATITSEIEEAAIKAWNTRADGMNIEEAKRILGDCEYMRTYFKSEIVDAVQWVLKTYPGNTRTDGWISVGTRLPEEYELVLVTNGLNRYWLDRIIPDRGWSESDEEWDGPGDAPTHWRPMPAPPEGE